MKPIAPFLFVSALSSAAAAQCPTWRPELSGALAPDGEIRALLVHDDDGPGPLPPALYVAGDFEQIGGVLTGCIARWDGVAWTSVGLLPPAPMTRAAHLAFYDEDGPGPQPAHLYASGAFPGLFPSSTQARFDGQQWLPLPVSDLDAALLVADLDGPGPQPERLYIAGQFLAAWDGANLSSLGGFYPMSSIAHANDLCVFDPDGPGPQLPRLVITGYFTGVGLPGALVQAMALAAFDGTTWSEFEGGLDFPAPLMLPEGQTLCVRAQPASGAPELVVGGRFAGANGLAALDVAAWSNGAWSALGAGIPLNPGQNVRALLDFDVDGAGPAPRELYAAGQFFAAGAVSAANIARWDGSAWSAIDGGLGGRVNALAAFDADAAGPEPVSLFPAGYFDSVNGIPSHKLARYTDRGCNALVCAGDGSLATGCPCNNLGAAGHGCANSQEASGGLLAYGGWTVAGTLHLDASQLPLDTTCVFVQAAGFAPNGALLGDGVSCLSGTLRRIAAKQTFFGAAVYPENETPIAQRSAQLGDPLGFGAVRYYQAIYRDGNPAFCASGASYNLTNGLRIVW